MKLKPLTYLSLYFVSAIPLLAGDGYELWLPGSPLVDMIDCSANSSVNMEILGQSETMEAAEAELINGLSILYPNWQYKLKVGTLSNLGKIDESEQEGMSALGEEGYLVQLEGDTILITANTDVGVLYGTFAFLRHIQTGGTVEQLPLFSVPRIRHRLLNHWDNLTGTVERGQAGRSLWDWFQLPDYVSPHYQDYARANASIGINGTVLTNVNANSLVLSVDYIKKAAAIADVMRPYGIKVYLTARFSSPMELGGLATADPLDPMVRNWWMEKAKEIYHHIPDFGGFLVKANSEGQPGPQDFGRTHADGANMLADALAPFGGIVMWRAFVYSHENTVDRHKQAFNEFVPLDGHFRRNVVIQAKNGAIDFMPREPFHPLFGAMPKTSLALELQITKEYLGGAIHLAYLGPLFEEILDSDTIVNGKGSTVASIVDGSLQGQEISVIAGVSNAGFVRNWTGHPLAQADWYAFGRLAWNPGLDSESIAREWVKLTFGSNPLLVKAITWMLLESREAVVNYSMPLGLHHIMARGHHYGPGPWVTGGRADWTSVYYHRADEKGIGFDRTPSGSNALEQYSPEIQEMWGNPNNIPQELLLWFHHVPWNKKMPSGRILWDELGFKYQQGVNSVRSWQKTWDGLTDLIDPQTHSHVAALLARQEREAIEYKDACLLYFQNFSRMPWPRDVEPAKYSLDHYMANERKLVPGDPSNQ